MLKLPSDFSIEEERLHTINLHSVISDPVRVWMPLSQLTTIMSRYPHLVKMRFDLLPNVRLLVWVTARFEHILYTKTAKQASRSVTLDFPYVLLNYTAPHAAGV
jgi:hypothetical protein